MYIRNGVYPYSLEQLKKDNPQVSFPAEINQSIMTEYKMYAVEPTEKPVVGLDKIVTEGQPQNINGTWKQTWNINDASKEQHLARVLQARKNEYPPMADYLDAVVKNDTAQIQKYINDCIAVKAKYPKP